MAVFKNVSTEIGDVLLIVSDVPIIGIIALQSFTDSTGGERAVNYFQKQFRYSVDGVNYSPWILLTNTNLQAVQVQSNDTLYLQYAYTHQGVEVDRSESLEFNSVTVDGQFINSPDGPVYQASNFAKYFIYNNVCSVAWSTNVLEKLYKQGIVPKYITRDFAGSNADDRDYLDFWRAITHYFALFVCLARQFQTFYTNSVLLLEYLTERGIIVTNSTQQADMLYIMQSFYDEVRQRGTRKVFQPKGTVTPTGSKTVDGEFLRLIDFKTLDELLVNLNKNEHIGWNIRNNSPTYKGLEGRLNVNKYYCDFIDDLHSISQLSISPQAPSYLSIVADPLVDHSVSMSESRSYSQSKSEYDPYGNNRVIRMRPPAPGNPQGLGKGGKRIVINNLLDYEVTFIIKAEQSPGVIDPRPLIWVVTESVPPGGIQINLAWTINAQPNTLVLSQVWDTDLNTTMNDIVNLLIGSMSGFTATWNSITGTFSLFAPFGTGTTYNGATANIQAYSTGGGVGTVVVAPNSGTPYVGSTLTFAGGVGGVLVPQPEFTFGIDCFDKNNNPVVPLNIKTLAAQNTFVTQQSLNRSEHYYFVRGIIFNSQNYKPFNPLINYPVGNVVSSSGNYYRCLIATTNGQDPIGSPNYWVQVPALSVTMNKQLNIGYGNNLVFSGTEVQCDPFILYDNNANSKNNLYVYNIRVQPLSSPTSKGFIGVTNFMEIWATLNNLKFTNQQIFNTLRKYLIPANTVPQVNFIPSDL